MATPWWVTTKYNFDPVQGSSQAFYDANTGRQVYEQGGKYYYALPTADTWTTGEDGQWVKTPGSVGEAVPNYGASAPSAQVIAPGIVRLADGTITKAVPLNGDAGDYSKLFEGAQGNGSFNQVLGQGAPQVQVVQGSDGTQYAALPTGTTNWTAQPDNSGFGSLFASNFAPLVMAALPFTGLGGTLTSALGDVGGRIATNTLGSVISGKDPVSALTSGIIGTGVNSIIPSFDTGMGAPVDSALKGALTGGAISTLTGGNALAGAVGGAGSSLAQSGLKSLASAGQDLVNSFSSNPAPSTAVDTLAANTTGPNPAQAWGNSVDNMDTFLGQFAATPSPANSDLAINGLSQQTAGQTLSEPFQQPASSLPWDQPNGSLNTYTEQQPVTNPAEPVTQSPASGGGNMAFFDEILGNYTGDMGEMSPFMTPQNPDPWAVNQNSAAPLFDLSGTAGSNYLDYGMTYQPTDGGLNLGYTQNLADSGTYIPSTDTSSAWNNFLKSIGASGIGQAASSLGGALTSPIAGLGNRSILGTGLAVAPALAAINYATNQTPFDTSKLQSIYDQYNPSAQTGAYDLATGQQRNALQSDLARRGVAGSSFGDQSLASFGTIRDLGRNALVNQGLSGQADIAAKILDAQAKQRATQNQLYGSALYALGGALSPRNGMGF